MFHPVLERELEFDIPLLHVNNSTNCAKKRTSKNNWTRGLTLNIHDNKINGNIIIIDNNKNIINLLSGPSIFKFSQHPNVFIDFHLDSIHRSGLPLLKGRSSNFEHLYIMGQKTKTGTGN